MMQTQWPGLGSGLDLASLDSAAGDGRQLWAGGPFGTGLPPQPVDAIARSWWNCGTGSANAGSPFGGSAGGGFGAVLGLVSGLVAALQQLATALLSQSGGAATGGASNPFSSGAQQQFQNVDISSTGDPHIAEVGTARTHGADAAVNDRWDSMTSHDDLVHSTQVEGGYRVSTTVTQPDANGVTSNQSATVHANFDQDAITMNRDGSFAIFDDGRQVQLGKGESATLSGGERVDVHQDGSLTVGAQAANGGTLSTTLRGTGAGVDVTTHGSNIALGGDAVTHGNPPSQAPHHPHPHPHPHRRQLEAQPPAPVQL